MREIVLSAAWGGHDEGTALHVVAPGCAIPKTFQVVDVVRADWLVSKGVATETPAPNEGTRQASKRKGKG